VLSLSRNGHPETTSSQEASSAEATGPLAARAPSAGRTLATLAGDRRPDPEVVPKASRRRFTSAYKRAIIAEVDAFQHSGAPSDIQFRTIGAILRREGLYYSTLRSFREQIARLDSSNSASKSSSSASLSGQSPSQRISQLERQKRSLEHKLAQAQAVIEVQKKVSELLGIALTTPNLDHDEDER
jgi:transposase